MDKLLARVPMTLAVALGLLVAVAVSIISLDSADRTEATSPAGCLGPGASASIIAVRDVDGDGVIDFTLDTPVLAGSAFTPDEQILFRVRFGNAGFSTCDVTDVHVWASIPGSKDPTTGANVWVKVCEATIIEGVGGTANVTRTCDGGTDGNNTGVTVDPAFPNGVLPYKPDSDHLQGNEYVADFLARGDTAGGKCTLTDAQKDPNQTPTAVCYGANQTNQWSYAEVTVDKVGPAKVTAGDDVEYTITVSSTGKNSVP